MIWMAEGRRSMGMVWKVWMVLLATVDNDVDVVGVEEEKEKGDGWSLTYDARVMPKPVAMDRVAAKHDSPTSWR